MSVILPLFSGKSAWSIAWTECRHLNPPPSQLTGKKVCVGIKQEQEQNPMKGGWDQLDSIATYNQEKISSKITTWLL